MYLSEKQASEVIEKMFVCTDCNQPVCLISEDVVSESVVHVNNKSVNTSSVSTKSVKTQFANVKFEKDELKCLTL